ncbi:MAG: UDPGP type 1 family protein [Spirochaetes bacterium]|nr:UDPGP type 1 family protein [Spirochaetota bacterium]
MISYNGYEDVINNVYKNNQEHVFEYWRELNNNEKENLLNELADVDFSLMNQLYEQSSNETESPDYSPCHHIALPSSESEIKKVSDARELGREYIKKGKTAALLVAGGQGTRLGFDGPKGMYPVGPVSGKSLFQIHAEKILKSSKKYNVTIPWLIMTSKSNHKDTVNYFSENNNFGIRKNDIHFFTQAMIPSLDSNGKLVLVTKCKLFMNPDGHGGTLTALSASGLLRELKKRGIETISYFQVDNPLVNIIDPVFIGFHIQNESDVSSKAVMKTGPDEKVGVFVEFENSRTGIIEYSDMSDDRKKAVDDNGNLLFGMGNIAVHLLKTEYIEAITSGGSISLPYHTAHKKIKALKSNSIQETEGLKFEKFIFDALSFTEKNTILETVRKEEFAPVKNAEGVDSPFSAKKLMSDLHRKWLTDKGISLPATAEIIEISPLLAVDPGDLNPDLKIPRDKHIYLDEN